jgi:hypothetical protein
LSCRWNCFSCRIRFISSSMWFVCCCFINLFTNHFSIHTYPPYPQKVVLHSITAQFSLRPSEIYIISVSDRK